MQIEQKLQTDIKYYFYFRTNCKTESKQKLKIFKTFHTKKKK